mmetsp:Transcript_58213/g.147646  ORF Transcript_58213/g.147646 Transcript_58213/m.147646 type:complete len:94 (-) Transcript_58213:997-1278(-)
MAFGVWLWLIANKRKTSFKRSLYLKAVLAFEPSPRRGLPERIEKCGLRDSCFPTEAGGQGATERGICHARHPAELRASLPSASLNIHMYGCNA